MLHAHSKEEEAKISNPVSPKVSQSNKGGKGHAGGTEISKGEGQQKDPSSIDKLNEITQRSRYRQININPGAVPRQ